MGQTARERTTIFDKKLLKQIDWISIILMLALFAIGIISIASIMASPFTGEEASLSDYMQKLNLEYVERQIVNFIIGLIGLLLMVVIDYRLLSRIINVVYIGNIIFLVILFATSKVRGIRGWFVLDALNRAIQPAELCKVTLIIMLAKIISQSMDEDGRLRGLRNIGRVMLFCMIPMVLVALQPDFGTAFVFICILVCMLFIARISWGYIITAVAVLGGGLPFAYFFVLADWQKGRIDAFLNPESDLSGSGYNVVQSKISIGSGGLYGKGLFSEGTLAQLRYVPERHTDFVFAGIVEGIGFVGGTVIIVLYFLLIFRWVLTAIKAKDRLGMCMVVGAIGMMVAHVFENIGMTMGLMPVTGIPLPFISYGGSNLLTNMMVVGLVINVWMRRRSSI